MFKTITVVCLAIMLFAAPASSQCILQKGAKVVVILQDGRLFAGVHPENVRVHVLSNIPPREIPNLKKFTGMDWSNGKLVTFGISRKDQPEIIQEVFLYTQPTDLKNCH